MVDDLGRYGLRKAIKKDGEAMLKALSRDNTVMVERKGKGPTIINNPFKGKSYAEIMDLLKD